MRTHLLFISLLLSGNAQALVSGYSVYCEVKIDHTKVAATQSNFPVYFDSTATNCQNALRTAANGGNVLSPPFDIYFTDSTDTLVPFERESYSGSTGSLQAHILLSVSSSTDTVFRLYLGKASDTDHSNAAGVWDANYMGVWHEVTPTSSWSYPARSGGNPIIAASSHSWEVSQVMEPIIMADPAVPGGLLMFYDGMAAPATFGLEQIGLARSTVAAPTVWVQDTGNPIVVDAQKHRLDSLQYLAGTFYLISTNDDSNSIDLFSATSPNGPWTKTSNILTPTGQGRNDGTAVSQGAVNYDGTTFTMIYAYRNGSNILPGYRYATATAITGPWTKGGSGDILSTGIFGSSDYGYMEWHQIIKIGSTYVLTYEAYDTAKGSTNGNYAINMAYSNSLTSGWTKSGANPIFTNSGQSGTMDRYHVATAAWYQIGGTWYLFYQGNSVAGPYYVGPWDMGMASISGDPTTAFIGGVADSTSNGNLLVDAASTTTSLLGGARGFNGSSAHQGTQANVLNATGAFTLEAWVKPSSLSQPSGMLVHAGADNGVSGGEGYGFAIGDGSGGTGAVLEGLISGVAWWNSGYTFSSTTVKHHIALVRSGGVNTFYVDGVAQSGTNSGTPSAPTGEFHIGSLGTNAALGFASASIDEVRASGIARPATWLATQVANQGSPASFYLSSALYTGLPATGVMIGSLKWQTRPGWDSISWWVNSSYNAGSKGITINEGQTTSSNSSFTFSGAGGVTNQKLTVLIRNTAGTTLLNNVVSTSAPFPATGSTWHHIYWTDANGTAALYVDGA